MRPINHRFKHIRGKALKKNQTEMEIIWLLRPLADVDKHSQSLATLYIENNETVKIVCGYGKTKIRCEISINTPALCLVARQKGKHEPLTYAFTRQVCRQIDQIGYR